MMATSVFYTEENRPKLHADPVDTSQECRLEYLNEGGANFVFRILQLNDDQDLPPRLKGKLLRVRKDLTHVSFASEQLASFNEHFKPLFPSENLVQFELVDIGHHLFARLNADLTQISRPLRRQTDYLPVQESHALLVTDMTPLPDDVLLQLKPKWLSQSPNAPRDAKRCRTCALRAKRASQQVRTATDAQQTCPLSLISESVKERERVAQRIIDDKVFQDFLINETPQLLRKLQFCQSELDSRGVLGIEGPDDELSICKAMTLRDCTLFLKRSGHHIDARFADLDLKLPEKIPQWRKVEKNLIADGWYTDTENETDWKEETVCVLSRR